MFDFALYGHYLVSKSKEHFHFVDDTYRGCQKNEYTF